MRAKFLIGGAVIAAAVVYLIVSSIGSAAQYSITVNEVKSKGQTMQGRNLRVEGYVIGDSIQYNPQASSLSFDIVNAREDLSATVKVDTLHVLYTGPKPDLLQHEAQAIAEGKLNPDGTFTANNLLLKCPTRYEEQLPTPTPPAQ